MQDTCFAAVMTLRPRSLVLVLSTLPVLACGGSEPVPAAPPAPPPTVSAASPAPPPAPQVKNDDLMYLEEVTGERALAFARAHDAVSEKTLTESPGFRSLEQRLSAIYGNKERIPGPRIEGGSLRNFWTDAEHPRGLWRQTTFADYKKAKPTWTTLIDVDALGKAENESFVYKGASCLPPQ